MGCFTGCFGTPYKGKRRNTPNRSLPIRRVHEVCQQSTLSTQMVISNPVQEGLMEKPDAAVRAPPLRNHTEQLDLTTHEHDLKSRKEEVNFDSNITTHEPAFVCEDETGISLDIDEQNDKVKEDGKLHKTDGNLAASSLEANTEEESKTNKKKKKKKKVRFDLNVTMYEPALACEDEIGISLDTDDQKDHAKEDEKFRSTNRNLAASSLEAYPVNYRYQHCNQNDDEYDEELGDVDLELDDEDGTYNGKDQEEEETYDSYFSMQFENMWPEQKREPRGAKTSNATSFDIKSTVPTSQCARDRSQYVYSVLNPVENLSQWNEIKTKHVPPNNSKKENIHHIEEQYVLHGSGQDNRFQMPRCKSTTISMEAKVTDDGLPISVAPREKAYMLKDMKDVAQILQEA